jgi:hypothetical protein
VHLLVNTAYRVQHYVPYKLLCFSLDFYFGAAVCMPSLLFYLPESAAISFSLIGLTVQVFLPDFLPLIIYRRVKSIFRVHLHKLLLCIRFFRTLSSNSMIYSSCREQRFLGAHMPISSKPLSQIINFILH